MFTTEFNHREIINAAPDAIAIGAGASVNRPHPLAGELTLRKIAYACGVNVRKPQPHDTAMSIAASGMGTAEFSRIVADGVRAVTLQRYAAQADHLAYVTPFEVNNFLPGQIPALDSDLKLEPLAEDAEIQQGVALVEGGVQSVRLTTFARAIGISREAIINDSTAAIGRVFAELGASAGRTEARLVADALEANQVLDDGAVTFDAAYSNVVASALSWEGFGEAAALLRTQLTQAGQRADMKARFLVVAPDIELTAQKMVFEAGLQVQVFALANLPAGRWFVLADPTISPAIGVLRLAGVESPIRVEPRKRPAEMDGAAVQVTADLGAFVARRTGIVRGGV